MSRAHAPLTGFLFFLLHNHTLSNGHIIKFKSHTINMPDIQITNSVPYTAWTRALSLNLVSGWYSEFFI